MKSLQLKLIINSFNRYSQLWSGAIMCGEQVGRGISPFLPDPEFLS